MEITFDDLSKIFRIKQTGENTWSGFLYPPSDRSIYPYRHPALEIIFRISGDPLVPTVSIHSIDDSGMTMWGSEKNREETLQKVLKFFQQWEPRCPDKDEIDRWAKLNGFFVDYW